MKLYTADAVALVEIWSGIKNYVPIKDQRHCADQFIATIEEAGLVDLSMASNDLYGVCDVFDSALRAYCRENGYNETETSDEWDD
jgi:hypothetical protein